MKLSCKTQTLERVKNKRDDEEIYMKTGKLQPSKPSNTILSHNFKPPSLYFAPALREALEQFKHLLIQRSSLKMRMRMRFQKLHI